ncbi:MAG: MFS transporter [Gemmatimonadaceae bacterium]|nr:MFS transporter [Gloeobacterales cyanobacterium ES-bin-141]
MRISLGLLGLAAFTVAADARVLDPLLPVIADEFHTGIGTVGLLVTAYTVPYGLFQLVYGPLGDRVGKLKVITAAMVAFALGTAGCVFVHDVALLALLRFLTGMVAAAVIPLSLAYIADNFPYQERQAALGKYMSAVVLGQILGSSLGGIFGEYFGWRDIFLVFGLFSLLVAVALWRGMKFAVEPQPRATLKTGSVFKPYWQLLKRGDARSVIIAVFIEGFFLFGAFAYIGAFLRDRYSLSYVVIGFLLSGLGVGGLIYSASVKQLVRLGENNLIGIGGLLVCGSYIAIATIQNWMLFIPLAVFMGLGLYMLHNTLQTRATELTPEARGTAVSLFAFSVFLGQGVGSAVFALAVSSVGYLPCFIAAGLAIAAMAFWLSSQSPVVPALRQS